MLRFIFKNSLYVCGKPAEVLEHLKELSLKYRYVNELLEVYRKNL